MLEKIKMLEKIDETITAVGILNRARFRVASVDPFDVAAWIVLDDHGRQLIESLPISVLREMAFYFGVFDSQSTKPA